MSKTWYVLYDGSSNDGRGEPSFMKRTTSKSEAYKHYLGCQKNPYSNGKARIITDEFELIANFQTDFNQF